MKRLLPLTILLAGILFPFPALMRYSSSYAWAFDRVFGTPASHVIMHAALFAALAVCVMGLLRRASRQWAAVISLAIVACAALGQEALQTLSAGVVPLADTLFDLGVDMASGLLGMLLGRWMLDRRARAGSKTPKDLLDPSGLQS